jgi:hypothetical protein
LVLSFDIWNEQPTPSVLQRFGIRHVVVQTGVLLQRNLQRIVARSTEFDVLAVWGARHESQFSEAGVRATEIVSVGSISEAVSRRRIEPGEAGLYVAVVLFKASNSASKYESTYRREQFASRLLLLTQLRRISEELNIDLRILIQSGSPKAIDWQCRVNKVCLGTDSLVPKEDNSLSSYGAVMSAGLVVGDQSSLLVEALGRGVKVLSVMYSDDPSLRLPFSGPWEMISPSYLTLRDRVKEVLAMSPGEWRSQIALAAHGICHISDDDDAIDRLDDLLEKLLGEATDVCWGSRPRRFLRRVLVE